MPANIRGRSLCISRGQTRCVNYRNRDSDRSPARHRAARSRIAWRNTHHWVASAVAAVDPTIMGTAPVPATEKVLQKAGLTMKDIDIIEMNEAFAVQALYFLDRFGMKWDDPRVNKWGGAIAYGHPLASSGPRLIAFLAGLFQENPTARYGLATMCVGRGQGYSAIWENLAAK